MKSQVPGERHPRSDAFRPFSGELASSVLEESFRGWSHADHAWRSRSALRLGALLMCAFIPADLAYLDWTRRSAAFTVLRVGWGLLALRWSATAAAAPVQTLDRRVCSLGLAAIAIMLASTATRPPGFQPHALSAMGLTMGIYLILPNRFWAAAGSALVLAAGYLAIAGRGESLRPTEATVVCGALLLANGAGVAGNVWLSRLARSEYLRQRAADEAHAERLAFLAATSHELRTPMHGVVACVELLAAAELTREQRELVGLMRSSIAGMAGLLAEAVHQVRGGTELPSVDPAVIDLHGFLDDLGALVRARAATHGVRVSWQRGDGVPRRVQADAGRLRQVLLNLVENALAHGARTSLWVHIDVGPRLDDGRVPVQFSVLDDGPGVPREMREAIFRPFVQAGPATRARAGMGLGLNICDRIARAMGGRIEVDDAPGGGACFRLCVPLVDATGAPLDAAGDAPPGGPGLDLLLVEDEAVSRRLMSLLLERDGHHVTVAASAEQAIEQVGAQRYDAVLMDLRLPRMDGVEAARRIRALGAQRCSVPIVAMSAHVAAADHDAMLRGDFHSLLCKPVDLPRLRATLAQLGAARGAPPSPGDAEPKSAPVETSWLDEAQIAEHASVLGEAQVGRLLALFVETTPATVDAMGLAAETGRLDDLAALAHRLAGAAESAGLARCARAAAAIEEAARAGERVSVDAILRLRRVHDGSCAAAQARAAVASDLARIAS